MVCGVLASNITAPDNPKDPTSFEVKLFRRDSRERGKLSGISVHVDETILREKIKVVNRDPSLEFSGNSSDQNGVFCICVKINYEWLPIWVGCP